MEFKRNLGRRFLRTCRIANPSMTDCRISTSRVAVKTRIPPGPERISNDPIDDSVFLRFMHRRPGYGAGGLPSSFPVAGEKLIEKLRWTDISGDRIRLDGLVPPPGCNLTVVEARKLLRLSQIERVKVKLKGVGKNHISYSQFMGICGEGCSNSDQSLEVAKMLDDSGAVIVLGNVVFLKPHEVVKAIEDLIPSSTAQQDDPRKAELENMEKQMEAMEKKAERMARKELRLGLGYLVVQTAIFLRLTFWELTWDVMEPICFFVTSGYAMAAYAFFLRTSKEPSFEAFFQARVSAKMKRLIKHHGFDIQKYNQLKRICDHSSPSP
ncbi:unnamed protein product [Cuscuta europaea]|uniref:Calcium uniporter protein C-terminal domain-containing protein n=1 Tax=Cuscuta europaea TaxID=41803 RepID=A0A9P1EAK3_CUSEU|nr:unnamed protein product [Cuscuta europaea]